MNTEMNSLYPHIQGLTYTTEFVIEIEKSNRKLILKTDKSFVL